LCVSLFPVITSELLGSSCCWRSAWCCVAYIQESLLKLTHKSEHQHEWFNEWKYIETLYFPCLQKC
jgi:hypothetical protein